MEANSPRTDETRQRRPIQVEDVEAGLGASRYKELEHFPYAVVVTAKIPQELWSGIFFSWLSLKGFMQAVHQMEQSQTYASSDGTTVTAIFVTMWTGADSLAEWLDSGYPVETLLEDLGIPSSDIRVDLMRDVS